VVQKPRLHRAEVLADPRYDRMKVGVLKGATAISTTATATLPYGEAHGHWRRFSPYYNESHHRFRAALREFIDREIRPTAAADDENGTVPSQELNLKMGSAGVIAAIFGSDTAVMDAYAPPLPGGLKVRVPPTCARVCHAMALQQSLPFFPHFWGGWDPCDKHTCGKHAQCRSARS
jgi:hypothetical protein